MDEMNYPKPNNNMILAIFATVCCCLPIGIYAIIRANKVNDYYYMQQYEAAQQAADDAKKWSIISIIVGAIWSILYGIWLFAMGGLAAIQ